MDVTRLAKQLGITESAVVRKARELAGLAAVRFPSMGQVRRGDRQHSRVGLEVASSLLTLTVWVPCMQATQAEVCVAAVCLELACQACVEGHAWGCTHSCSQQSHLLSSLPAR